VFFPRVVQRRRMQQESQRVKYESEVKAKVASAAFAREHLSSLLNDVFDHLVTEGHFVDPLSREVCAVEVAVSS
jgi:hypothetical protein